jgi:hypothetical protein
MYLVKVHNCIHNSPAAAGILSQMNPNPVSMRSVLILSYYVYVVLMFYFLQVL